MNIEQANKIPIAQILSKLGTLPQRTNGRKTLYFSPLRNDLKPLFWVNEIKNTWRDYGDMRWKGGNTVCLVQAFLNSENQDGTVPDALRWIRSMTDYIPRINPVRVVDYAEDKTNLILRKVSGVEMVGLFIYAESRRIAKPVIEEYFKEVHFFNLKTKKTMIALGMKNESKGYHVRNHLFKGTVQKQNITLIRGTSERKTGVHIFEDMMDFASIVTQRKGLAFEDDVIILHSLNCLDSAWAHLHQFGLYKFCYTWMDNDQSGKEATSSWRGFCKTQEKRLTHVSMNKLYATFKDVNAHHMAQPELQDEQ